MRRDEQDWLLFGRYPASELPSESTISDSARGRDLIVQKTGWRFLRDAGIDLSLPTS
jgi:hypothetical protein